MGTQIAVIGDIDGQFVTGMYNGGHCHRQTVEQNGIFPPFQRLEQAGGDLPCAPHELLDLFALLLGGNIQL